MCTRFVYNGNDIITGFNFDIDLAVWQHKVMTEPERFYIGIKRPDGKYHSYHGVNRNGNAGTLLYVHENLDGAWHEGHLTIAELTERFIKAELSFDDALELVRTRDIVYAADATMQAMLSDAHGRALIIEPGVGWREEKARYSLMTNYSVLDPTSTRDFIVPGDDRYERAVKLLDKYSNNFTVSDAFDVLRQVRQEGEWATRVSFVYSVNEQAVYYAENNDFEHITKFEFQKEAI